MNLTGGVLGTRPPGKPLNGLFGERFSTDKRLVEDLTGGFFWESLSGSCLVTIWPFPGLPLPGVSALQEKEVGTETGMRPQESSDALYFFSPPGWESGKRYVNNSTSPVTLDDTLTSLVGFPI